MGGWEYRNGLVRSFICPSYFSGFSAFMDELLKRLISNLVDTFILVLLVMLCWIHILWWPLIGRAVFMHSGQTTQEINLKFVRYIHYGTPHPWLNCGLAPLNYHFPAYDWCNSFYQFANEPLIRLSSNLLGQIIMGCPQPGQLSVTLHWISAISRPLIYPVVSTHLQKNHRSDFVQIWWANSLWSSSAR